jgi:hypothetical protein
MRQRNSIVVPGVAAKPPRAVAVDSDDPPHVDTGLRSE